MCLHAVGWPQEAKLSPQLYNGKLGNAEQHPEDSMLIDILSDNDEKLQDICYSQTVLNTIV